MDYKKLYDSIITKRMNVCALGYTERHHIIPRSLGGTDAEDNLVTLTAREHFICHYLLAKMYKENTLEWHKMNHAFTMMRACNVRHNRYVNARLYEALAKNRSVVMSAIQSGDGNSQYGTMWICNPERQESIKVPKSSIIPDGWAKGRIVDFSTCKRCKTCSKYIVGTQGSYCSKECRNKIRPHYEELIDNNVAEILKKFDEVRSVAKVSKWLGLDYTRKEGHKYLSKLLKMHGRQLMKRRNSAQ